MQPKSRDLPKGWHGHVLTLVLWETQVVHRAPCRLPSRAEPAAHSCSLHVKPDFPIKRCLLFLPWLLGSQLSSNLGLHLPCSTARSKELQGLCALGSATEMSSSFLWQWVDSALVASGKMLFAFFLLLYLYHAWSP